MVLKGKLNSRSTGRSREDEMFIVVSERQLSYVQSCTKEEKKTQRKTKQKQSCSFLASMRLTLAYFWQFLLWKKEVFLQPDLFYVFFFKWSQTAVVSYGSTIISESASGAWSGQHKVMFIMNQIFLEVSPLWLFGEQIYILHLFHLISPPWDVTRKQPGSTVYLQTLCIFI